MRRVEVEDPQRIGNYAIRARLGQGAMGTVYLGLSPGGRSVALKVVRAELARDPEFRDRFRQEIDSARAVGGFWTAAVVDADPSAEQPWLATEYVPGPTLAEAVERHGPLPEPALLRLTAGLAEALAAIHAAGLLHRDLKPSNVLLAADGPRVIDFGIAKAVHAAHGVTGTGIVVGTPGFLSPEQIEAGEVGPASDVFALGSVLVHAATARGPFGDFGLATTLYKIVHGQPDLDGMPARLSAIASRCLNPRPDLRPTPGELLEEIGHPEHAEWLPPAVRDLVEEHRTRMLAPVARPVTRMYTGAEPVAAPVTVDPPTGNSETAISGAGGAPGAGAAAFAGGFAPAGAGSAGESGGAGSAPDRAESVSGESSGGDRAATGFRPGGPTGPHAPSAPGVGGPDPARGGEPGALAEDSRTERVEPARNETDLGAAALAEDLPTESVTPARPDAGPAGRTVELPSGTGGLPSGAGSDVSPGTGGAESTGAGSWPGALGPRPGESGAAAVAPQPLAAEPGSLPGGPRSADGGSPDPGSGGRAPGTGAAWAGDGEAPDVRGSGSRDVVVSGFGVGKRGSGAGLPAQYRPDAAGAPARVVFESGRIRPFVYSLGSGTASLFFLGWSGVERYNTRPAVILFMIAAGLGVLALGALWTSLRPKSVVEVSGQGIVVLRPGRRVRVDWQQVARVRVTEGVAGRPWLVVWPRAGVPGLGSGESGMRLAPVGHWVGPRRRARDVADLRTALTWYGGSAYDPTP